MFGVGQDMTKLVWMSDLHFTQAGHVLGHDPRIRLRAAIDHINNNHTDAALCVVTGDMVNRGTQADYHGLNDRLGDLCIPYLPVVGNHDNRTLFRRVLPLPIGCMDGFVQFKVDTPDGVIVCLDTQKAHSDAGEFCQQRKAWLRAVLTDAGDRPVYLFMHHPPLPLGLPMQDTECMQDGTEFLHLVSSFTCVKYMFIGHVHRPISGTVAGIPFACLPSVLYQAPAPRPAWTWESFKPAQEAPQIGVIKINQGAVTLQYETFCDYRVGTQAGAALALADC